MNDEIIRKSVKEEFKKKKENMSVMLEQCRKLSIKIYTPFSRQLATVDDNTLIRFRVRWINRQIRFFPKQRVESRIL